MLPIAVSFSWSVSSSPFIHPNYFGHMTKFYVNILGFFLLNTLYYIVHSCRQTLSGFRGSVTNTSMRYPCLQIFVCGQPSSCETSSLLTVLISFPGNEDAGMKIIRTRYKIQVDERRKCAGHHRNCLFSVHEKRMHKNSYA